MKVFFLFVLTGSMLFAGTNQQSYNAQKIDRSFLALLKTEKENSSHVLKPFLAKAQMQRNGLYDVIIYSSASTEAEAVGVKPLARFSQLFTAKVTLEQIRQLSNLSSVQFIEAPKMRYPLLDKSLVEMKVDKVHQGQVNGTAYKGKGVIVGIIDSGIDWKHEDFRSNSDNTKSRILFLWDQTDERSDVGPASFNYGAEYSQADINDELDGSPAGKVLEKDISGHGTHVAGTAAGDGSASSGKYTGVAPEADLIIVKGGDGGFTTSNIVNGISYIIQKAATLGKPVVINMSLGGHDGSHDGTSTEEIAVNGVLNNAAGKQIVIAAGNEGNDGIHYDATVTQSGSKTFSFTIPSYTANGDTQDDYAYFTMWYKNGDNLTVKVKSPTGSEISASTGQKQQLSSNDGYIEIDNAQSGTTAINNMKNCLITVSDADADKIPKEGSWEITVTGTTVTQGGAFDIWMAAASMSSVEFATPTFTKLIGMPATAEKSLTVASYVTKWSWTSTDGQNYNYNGTSRVNDYSTFSSMGPSRDGRQKPDVAAPGQAIVSALSKNATFDTPYIVTGNKYVVEQGTSMATPHISGLVALMLQAKPTLTSAQIREKINATARKDAFTGNSWSARWGNGKADAVAALQSVLSVSKEGNSVPSVFSLEQNYPNPFNPETKISFSIPQAGFVTVDVYSSLGQKVSTLVHEQLEQGSYSATFSGKGLASGLYFYTLRVGNHSETKKMLLLQ